MDVGTLRDCEMCFDKKLHHVCMTEHPQLKIFAGKLSKTYACFDCSVYLGISSQRVEVDADDFQEHFATIDWSKIRTQSTLTLAAMLASSPRPVLQPYSVRIFTVCFSYAATELAMQRNSSITRNIIKDYNEECQECDGGAAVDHGDPLLLQCSFCNLCYHNKDSCLKPDGGSAITSRDASNEDLDWCCPKCWAGALKKMMVTNRAVVGKKVTIRRTAKAKAKANATAKATATAKSAPLATKRSAASSSSSSSLVAPGELSRLLLISSRFIHDGNATHLQGAVRPRRRRRRKRRRVRRSRYLAQRCP